MIKKGKCIICREENVEMSDEHVFPEAIKGHYHVYNVCKVCNSKMGEHIDPLLTNHSLIEGYRFSHKMKGKKGWICVLFILAGLVIGGLLGQLAQSVDFLWWFSYGQEFGMESPLVLDLSVFKLTIGLTININIASIIGVLLALLIYKKAV